MSVNVYTEWGQLKEIIVGDCVNIDDLNIDLSFKYFFAQNIQDKIIKNSLPLQKKLVEQRQEDFDHLAQTLKDLHIDVKRPKKLELVQKFKTPHFEDWTKPVDNPRDQVFVYGNEIIETSCLWRARYFENDLMKDIFMEYFKQGAKWSSSPRPQMQDQSFDLSYIDRTKNLSIDWTHYDGLTKNFEIMFDGAQCLKFGKDIVMNVSNRNHELGAQWLTRHLGTNARIHQVRLTDHHIDGMFMPLRPGLLLINPSTMPSKIDQLPTALKKWDRIILPILSNQKEDELPLLASANILMNVLPINEKTTMIFGQTLEETRPLEKILKAQGQDVIAIRFRHSRLFGGGLHCATLDTVRDDHAEDYFS
jgi:glycine amidinotransferase